MRRYIESQGEANHDAIRNRFECYLRRHRRSVSYYMWHLGNVSGQNHKIERERVQRFIETAPYERLDIVLAK